VLHLREQEALEKERLRRESEEARAEEVRRLKRLADEIYNLETWVTKVCPQWEKDELDRQRREEMEEERLLPLNMPEPEQPTSWALTATGSAATARTESDNLSENVVRAESDASARIPISRSESGASDRKGKHLFMLLRKSAKAVQVCGVKICLFPTWWSLIGVVSEICPGDYKAAPWGYPNRLLLCSLRLLPDLHPLRDAVRLSTSAFDHRIYRGPSVLENLGELVPHGCCAHGT
jgi:hypothetical protein